MRSYGAFLGEGTISCVVGLRLRNVSSMHPVWPLVDSQWMAHLLNIPANTLQVLLRPSSNSELYAVSQR